MSTEPTTVQTDESLFQRWSEGDAAAGQRLFKRHFEPLLRFFRRQLGDDVQDLVQQTFLGCIEARSRHPKLDNFKAFLYAIARNQLYKHLRRRSGQPAAVVGVTSVADLLPTPSRLIGEREDMVALVDALTRLPLEQQLALYFYYMLDLTAPQTGAALGGLGVPAVRSRLRRGLAALREELLGARPRPPLADSMATLDHWEAKLPPLGPGESDQGPDEIRVPGEID
ncbi:MAG: sigma-70 family RNA polymerase sigma factor [Nannocystaceae bacterium]